MQPFWGTLHLTDRTFRQLDITHTCVIVFPLCGSPQFPPNPAAFNTDINPAPFIYHSVRRGGPGSFQFSLILTQHLYCERLGVDVHASNRPRNVCDAPKTPVPAQSGRVYIYAARIYSNRYGRGRDKSGDFSRFFFSVVKGKRDRRFVCRQINFVSRIKMCTRRR